MSGRTFVVTGATSGIGWECASILAASGARVIGVGRDAARCAAAARALGVDVVTADLSTLAGMRAAAAAVAARTGRVDALVNNAGAFSFRRRETVDGVELTLAVGWLSGFVLAGLLLPQLEAAPEGRVVTVSSGSHYAGRMRWHDLGLRRGYNGLKAYDASKLATVLFTRELARRLHARGSRVSAYAVDPGLVKTDIGAKGAPAVVRLAWRVRTRNGISAREAAESVCWCAADPAAAGHSGLYWKEREVLVPSARARDARDAARLWAVGEAISGLVYPAHGAVRAEGAAARAIA